MLYFYFPLPYLLIALLSIVIKYEVAFKIVTILGTFLLPLTTYLAAKALKFKFPFPIIAAAFSLPFLFMESYSIYGGNILSTLAGEFGYSLSFALAILFLALLYRDIEEQKFRISTGVLLTAVALSHIIPLIMVVLFSTYFLARRPNLKCFGILAGVFGTGLLLSAFWGIPLVARIGYTAHMNWNQLKGLAEAFPAPVRPFLVLTAIGIAGSIIKRDRRMNFILWATVVTESLFFLLPDGRLWNGRIVPFLYYFTFIWAGYGLWVLRQFLARIFYEYMLLPKRYAEYVIAAVAVTAVLYNIFSSSQVASTWIKWNYSGYEGKENWSSFKEINDYIKNLPPGRVMWEHSSKTDALGTPRAFELLPYFTGHPSMEGLLVEAAFSAPYHFVNQDELSKQPSCAIQGVNYPGLNIPNGIRHLKLYNVRYFIAVSSEVKAGLKKEHGLKQLKVFKVPNTDLEYALFELKTDGYVTIPKNQPLLVKTEDWNKTALAWYERPELLDTPLIDAGRVKGLEKKFGYADPGLKRLESTPLETKGSVTGVKVTDDEVKFSTTAIGVPHLVKVSYFPNWKAKGADGPYLASPSLMIVIPRQKNVTLYFGNTAVETAGKSMSIAGWLLVAIYGAVLFRRRLKLTSESKIYGAHQGEKVTPAIKQKEDSA